MRRKLRRFTSLALALAMLMTSPGMTAMAADNGGLDVTAFIDTETETAGTETAETAPVQTETTAPETAPVQPETTVTETAPAEPETPAPEVSETQTEGTQPEVSVEEEIVISDGTESETPGGTEGTEAGTVTEDAGSGGEDIIITPDNGTGTEGESEPETEEETELLPEIFEYSAEGFEGEYSMSAESIVDEYALELIYLLLEEREIRMPLEVNVLSGTISDPEEGVTVTIHDLTMDPETVGLYHIIDMLGTDTKIEKLDYTTDPEQKTVTFTTDSFSPFVFASMTAEEIKEQEVEEALEEETETETEAETEAPVEETETEAPVAETEVPVEETETESELALEDGIALDSVNALSADNVVEIGRFDASISDGAELNEEGNYVWTPIDTDESYHSFIYRVSYDTSGEFYMDPETFQITVPKRLLLDRDGAYADTYEMSLPEENTPGLTDANPFVYREEGDSIVIYNRIEIQAAQSGFFEIAYVTSEKTWEYQDYNGVSSDEFHASFIYGDQEAEASAPPVYINTYARVTSTQKQRPEFYTSWQSSWGTKPADADDYYYLVWNIRTYTEANQPYVYSISDDFEAYGEVVGVKYAGEYRYTALPHSVTLTREYIYPNYRTDSVLTRLSKAEYESLQSWTVVNTETVTVHPIDGKDADSKATSSRSYYYEKPHFVRPIGHFYSEKWGLDYRGREALDSTYLAVRDDPVEAFVGGEAETLGEFPYHTYMRGYPYPWTIAEGADPDDPESYGQVPITYTFTDETLQLYDSASNQTIDLEDADYTFTGLEFSTTYYDETYDEEDFSYSTVTADLTNDVIELYIRRSGEGEYVKVGEYHPGSRSWTNTTVDISANGEAVTFNSSVAGYRVVTSNAHYYTYVGMEPTVALKNTETVMAYAVPNAELMILRNTSNCAVTEADGSDIVSFTKTGTAYAGMEYHAGRLSKTFNGIRNNVMTRVAEVDWRITASELNLTTDQYILQESGTFYDLLPAGAAYVDGSTSVYADGVRVRDGVFSVEATDNYRNSGRTLLKVEINTSADCYEVLYSSLHEHESLQDFGRTVLNTVAYETGNDKLGEGLPDDGGSVTEKELMTDLDPDTDEEKFIYTEARKSLAIPLYASLGLDKQVKAERDSTYVNSTVTNQNGTYSYRLRFSTDDVTRAKDLVLYDSLENFVTTAGESSDWHGVLQSIDLSQPIGLGIAPVIYYSTVADPDTDGFNGDLTDASVWSTTAPEDMADVTAVAIDLRKTESGEDYVLPKNSGVTVTLYMRAPATVETDELDPVAYNNIYLYSTVMDDAGSSETKTIHQDYTQIRYRTIADIPLHKVNSEDGKGVEGLSFTLTGRSDYGTAVEKTLTTNQDGELVFQDIERGTYSLQETGFLDDFLADDTIYTVVVSPAGEVTITSQEVPDGLTRDEIGYVIENDPRIHGDLLLSKRGMIDRSTTTRALDGVTFRLSGTSDYGNEILMYDTSEDGILQFSNIELGSYTLAETQTVDGYILPQETYTVVCDENGNVGIPGGSMDTSGNYVIKNEPYHQFSLIKTSSYNNTQLEGAVFRLTGTSDYGTAVDMEVATGTNGLANFTGLEPGVYVLEEITAPEGHRLDVTKRAVSITAEGYVTVEGLEEQADGVFTCINQRIPEDTVVVTKKWVDGLTGEEADNREYPNLHISSYEYVENAAAASLSVDETDASVDKSNTGTEGMINTENTEAAEETQAQKTVASGADQTAPKTEAVAEVDPAGDTTPTAQLTANTSAIKTSSAPEEAPTNEEIEISEGDSIEIQDTVEVAAGAVVYEGDWGTCHWTIDEDGVLTIGEGTGTSTFLYYEVPWYDYRANITEVKTSGTVILPLMTDNLFSGCTSLISADLSGFNTSNTQTFRNLFKDCISLTSLDISGWDTSNVTETGWMFDGCSSLTSLDLSNWNTSKIRDAYNMFQDCSSLTSLNVSSWSTESMENISFMFEGCSSLMSLNISEWDTSNVEDMERLFTDCRSLTSLDINKWNTGNVTNMHSMFDGCSGLTSLNLSGWNTSNVTDMSLMFDGCSNLTSLDISTWDTGNVTTMEQMFQSCGNLTSLNLSTWDTGNVTTMYCMFEYCRSLVSLNLENWNTTNVTTMRNMFSQCNNLASLNISSWNTGNVKTMSYMFNECNSLTSLDISGWDTGSVTNMSYMFYRCIALTSLDISGWDTGNVTNMSYMFYACLALTSLNLSSWDTENVTNMSYTFAICSGLASLDVSGWDTGNVIDTRSMFSNCSRLTSLDVNRWNTGTVTDMNNMFYGCIALISLDLSEWDTGNVTNMNSMFYNCCSLISLDLSGWDTGNVTRMAFMFCDCSGLTSLNVSSWNTSNATSMESMFHGCVTLTQLDVSSWNTGNVTDMSSMFQNCNAITSLDLSGWNTSSVTDMNSMFWNCWDLTSLDLSGWNTENVDINVNWMNLMLANCNELSEISLSETFINKSGTSFSFPTPPSKEPYTGNWTHTTPYNHTDAISATDLRTKYSSADTAENLTWYWEREGEDPYNQDRDSADGVLIEDGNTTVNVYDPTIDTIDKIDSFVDADGNPTGYWTKLTDDTWTYTFFVYEADVPWLVWEDVPEGYVSDHDPEHALSIMTGTDEAIITNTLESLPETGSLELSKQVSQPKQGSDPSATDSFVFEITLTDAEGNALSGVATYGDVAFRDGKASVTLHADETVIMTDIPAGTNYEMVEVSMPGSYTQDSFENNTGTITADTTAQAVCVNTHQPPSGGGDPGEGGDEPVSGGFKLTKVCEDEDIGFTFHVSLTGLLVNTRYSYTGADGSAVSFTADRDGYADLAVTLRNGEEVAFDGLPFGSTYQVTEDASNYRASFIVTDTNNLGLIATNSRRNTATDTALSTARETLDSGEDVTITFTNTIDSFPVTLLKQDQFGEFVTGATLQVKQGDDVIEEWVSEEDASKQLTLKPGTYILHEVSAPEGYGIAEDIEFTVGSDGGIITTEPVSMIVMTDGKNAITVKIRKTDGVNLLAGAELKITNAAGETVDTWTSDGTEHEVMLDMGETYTLTEVNPPEGYKKAEDISITVNEDGTITAGNVTSREPTVNMVDEPIVVKIRKTDGTNILSGASLELRDASGAVVDSWTSAETDREISLKAGQTYTLTETAVPDGYAYAEDITITVDTDGDILVGGEAPADNTIVMVDDPIRVTIRKTDGENLLERAELKLTDSQGTETTWTTDTTEKELTLNAGETYTLTEVSAPEGFMLAEDITIAVERDGTIKVNGETSTDGVITMVDRPLVKVTIQKTDGTGLIEGAQLSLLDSEGNAVESWTTEAGKTHEVSLEPGSVYMLTEVKAPDGYNLADDIRIEVSEEGAVTIDGQVSSDNIVTMVDTKVILGLFPSTGFNGWYWWAGAAFAGMVLLVLFFWKRRPVR